MLGYMLQNIYRFLIPITIGACSHLGYMLGYFAFCSPRGSQKGAYQLVYSIGSSSLLLIKENQENPFLLLMFFTHWYSVRESSNPSKVCLRCFTNRIQPYGLSNRTEKQRKQV